MQNRTLRPTSWLARRLGISVTSVERLRSTRPEDLPPAILIGASIRYDEARVEAWLTERINRQNALTGTPEEGGDDDHAD